MLLRPSGIRRRRPMLGSFHETGHGPRSVLRLSVSRRCSSTRTASAWRRVRFRTSVRVLQGSVHGGQSRGGRLDDARQRPSGLFLLLTLLGGGRSLLLLLHLLRLPLFLSAVSSVLGRRFLRCLASSFQHSLRLRRGVGPGDEAGQGPGSLAEAGEQRRLSLGRLSRLLRRGFRGRESWRTGVSFMRRLRSFSFLDRRCSCCCCC